MEETEEETNETTMLSWGVRRRGGGARAPSSSGLGTPLSRTYIKHSTYVQSSIYLPKLFLRFKFLGFISYVKLPSGMF